MRILKAFKGLTLYSNVELLVSALFDTLSSIVTTSNPRLVLGGTHLYFCKPLKAIFCVRGRTDDLYHLLPGREGSVEKFIVNSLREGDVFIDVGANVGYYSILAAKRGAKVVAIEPIPETVAVLKVNLRLNGLSDTVHVVPNCLFSAPALLTFFVPSSGHFGLATLYPSLGRFRKVKIPCATLAELLAGFERVKLIKIDAEGAEYDILLGAEHSLAKIENIVVEISRNLDKIVEYLQLNGFKIKPLGFTTYILAMR